MRPTEQGISPGAPAERRMASLSTPESAVHARSHDFVVRRVITTGELTQVDQLVTRRYAWRGYRSSTLAGVSEVATFAAWSVTGGGQPLGTLTLRSGIRQRLECENTFEAEIAPYRNRGDRICEVCSLAIESEDPERGLDIFGMLFHVAYLHALMLGVNRLFSEVNPRHAPVYRRSLGFSPIGDVRHCTRANAPAVLVSANSSFITSQIAQYAGARSSSGRRLPLYSRFFPREEAGDVARRLLHMEAPVIWGSAT